MPTVDADRQWGVGRTMVTVAVCLLQVYSTTISRAQESLSEPHAPPESDQLNPVEEYREYLDTLEFSHGPFSDKLPEPLTSLGTALYEQGAYGDARTAYSRALEIIRINEGLYSLSQIPVLERIIGNLAAMGDWHSVDETFHRMFWIHRRALGESGPEILLAIEKQIAWHYTAVNFTSGATTAGHLLRARELSALAVEIIERRQERHDRELAAWLYRQNQVEYYIAVAVQRGGDTGLALLDDLAYHQLRYGYDTASEWLVRKIYLDGLKNFSRIINRLGKVSGPQSELAMTAVYEADWNMLFNKYGHAARLYRDAYSQLLESGIAAADLSTYFDHPVILPVERYRLDPDSDAALTDLRTGGNAATPAAPTQDAAYAAEPDFVAWSNALPGVRMPSRGYLDFTPPPAAGRATATFDVDATGLAERIKILNYSRKHHFGRSRAYETIWSMQFRPRLENGEARPATGLTVNYVLPD